MRSKLKISPVLFLTISIIYIFNSTLILYSIVSLNYWQTCIFNYTFLIYFIIFMWKGKIIKNFGISAMVLYYMAAISFGFPLGFLIDPDFAASKLLREKLFYGEYFDRYIALSIISISSIILGLVIRFEIFNDKRKKKNKYIKLDNQNNYYIIGSFLIIIYATYMGTSWLLGKIPTEYLAYKEWSGNQVQNYLKILYWIGTLFVMVSGSKKQIIKISFVFIIPTLILLLTGNRNDILYPIIIGVGIYVHRFKTIPKKLLSLIIFFLVIISPIIAATRSTGIMVETDFPVRELISSSFIELGGQIASVSHMFAWLENGESYAFGGTYIISSIALFFGSINPEIREYYFNSRFSIESRLPTLAFTMSAEIYYNFALFGVIIVYLIISAYMRKKENSILTMDELVRYSFNMFILLHLVRNQFYFSGIYFLIFYILYFFEKKTRVSLMSKTKTNRNEKSDSDEIYE